MDQNAYQVVNQCLVDFGKELLDEVAKHGEVVSIKAKKMLVKQGHIIRHLPIVIDGAIKVFTEEEGVNFLLYYINPGATCVFSFANLFGKKPVNFSGVAEKDSTILLLPSEKAKEWMYRYPAFSDLILGAYQKNYDDLLRTTKQIICYDLEGRLTNYLHDKATVLGSELLNISHQSIADDLATSREVISRILKKMEIGGKIQQVGRKIQLLNL